MIPPELAPPPLEYGHLGDFGGHAALNSLFRNAPNGPGSRLPLNESSLCGLGNRVVSLANDAGDAAWQVTKIGGAVTGYGILTNNPAVVTGGATVLAVGGLLGTGAGALQVTGGIMQGLGGGGFKNAVAGTVSIGSGVLLSKALHASIPPGWHGATRAKAVENNTITGNTIGALQSLIGWLAPTQANCF